LKGAGACGPLSGKSMRPAYGKRVFGTGASLSRATSQADHLYLHVFVALDARRRDPSSLRSGAGSMQVGSPEPMAFIIGKTAPHETAPFAKRPSRAEHL
jgi:hypothetical protein